MSKLITKQKNRVARMEVKRKKRERRAEGDYYYCNCDTL